MECPYCGAELVWEDSYNSGFPESWSGTAGNGLHYPSTYKKLGDIFRCPNFEGFEDLEEAREYQKEYGQDDSALEDIICNSSIFNGFFYTDLYGSLYEGYPC